MGRQAAVPSSLPSAPQPRASARGPILLLRSQLYPCPTLHRAVPCSRRALPHPHAPAAEPSGCTEDMRQPGCSPPAHSTLLGCSGGAWAELAQSAMGTNSFGCSALLCPQDLHAMGESCSPRTRHRHRPDTRRHAGKHLAQDGAMDAAAATNPGGPSPRLRTAARGAPAAHTSPVCTQATLAHTHGASTYAAARKEGWCPAAWLLGWESSSCRLPAAARSLSPTSLPLVFRRVLPKARWGRRLTRAVSPGEPGAPFARQVSLTPQLPATPSLPLWEEKIDFSSSRWC